MRTKTERQILETVSLILFYFVFSLAYTCYFEDPRITSFSQKYKILIHNFWGPNSNLITSGDPQRIVEE